MKSEALHQSRAILFDYGGTLDSEGERWPDRFYALYEEVAPDVPREEIKRAFYHAEEACYADPNVTRLDLRALMGAHVRLQFEALGLKDRRKERALAEMFCVASEECMLRASRLLRQAHARYKLGVVSNFYGNLAVVLEKAGLLPLLDVVVDSNVVGKQKPDLEIFRCALEKLELDAQQVIFVGDSYERDIVPSRQLGMKTIWLKRPNADAMGSGEADISISSLAELEALIL
jgi:HAD superfamily hydrolase (TIGR01509 family)